MGRYLDIARRTAARLPEEAEPLGTAPNRAVTLRDHARRASTCDELGEVLDAAQAAFDSGEVTCQEVETLTGYVADRSRQVPEHAEDGHLSELLAQQPVVRVRSRLLGEVVVWVADAAKAPDTGEVIYREAELRSLVGRDPEMIRAIHLTKKALDGEVTE